MGAKYPQWTSSISRRCTRKSVGVLLGAGCCAGRIYKGVVQMSICERCGTEKVWVDMPSTDMEVVAGIMVERETQDYRLMCPNMDCFEVAEGETDFVPF